MFLADSNHLTTNAKTDDKTRQGIVSLPIFAKFIYLNKAETNIGMDKIASQKRSFGSALLMFKGRRTKIISAVKEAKIAAMASSYPNP